MPAWYRPEGRGFLAGAPPRHPWPGDPDEPPLGDVDHGLFDEVIWPRLAGRASGWRNAYTACGFSGACCMPLPEKVHAGPRSGCGGTASGDRY